MTAPSLVLSLDLDGPAEYAALHGVDVSGEGVDTQLMYAAPLRRFVDLCHRAGAPGTVFVIGRDLNAHTAAILKPLAADGFEIGCHSHQHHYQLSRLSVADTAHDIGTAVTAQQHWLGSAPAGFRAPGYHLSTALFDALETLGFAYDSSVLASLPYYAAKAAVVAWYRLRGRPSATLLGSPGPNLAPTAPYRPGRNPYRRGGRALMELPLAVATPLRLPITGASWPLAPAPLRRLMLADLRRQRCIVLNMHGMDLIDANADGLPAALTARQPELRLPLDVRLRRLHNLVGDLARSHKACTAADAAQTHRTLSP